MSTRKRLKVKINVIRATEKTMQDKKEQILHSEALKRFKKLSIKKRMPNKEVLGIMLRDDKFMNMLGGDIEDIRNIWKQETG